MTSTETTSTELAAPGDIAAAVGVSVGALAIRADQTELEPAQQRALAFIGLEKAPAPAVQAFLHLCQRTGLDPWAKQIYLIERQGKWTPQTGIDGFRVIAERHPEFAGTTDILWAGEDGVWTDLWPSKNKDPYAARCSVIRRDREQPITATVLFAEYTSGQAKWKTSPAHMIGKCAEAGALRRAFPQDFAGLVIDEEAQALTAQATRTRVTSHRDSGPVDVGELTGQRAAPATTDAAPAPAPAGDPYAPPPLPGGSKRATNDHTKRLMAAARRPESPEDTKEWAEHVLQRDIRSWGVLTCDQANELIAKLEAGPPPGGWHVVEVVEPAAPAADADDDHAEEYAQLEAERDAAQQGQLGDASAEQ